MILVRLGGGPLGGAYMLTGSTALPCFIHSLLLPSTRSSSSSSRSLHGGTEALDSENQITAGLGFP
jgi:hypothetical protein